MCRVCVCFSRFQFPTAHRKSCLQAIALHLHRLSPPAIDDKQTRRKRILTDRMHKQIPNSTNSQIRRHCTLYLVTSHKCLAEGRPSHKCTPNLASLSETSTRSHVRLWGFTSGSITHSHPATVLLQRTKGQRNQPLSGTRVRASLRPPPHLPSMFRRHVADIVISHQVTWSHALTPETR